MTINEFNRLKRAIKNGRKVTGIQSYYGNLVPVEKVEVNDYFVIPYYMVFLDGKWVTQRSVMPYTRVRRFTLD